LAAKAFCREVLDKKEIFMAKSLGDLLADLISDLLAGLAKLLDRPPEANPDFARISEDAGRSTIDVLANDRDPDRDASLHIASIKTTGLKGTASISADGRHIVYDPGNAFQSLAAGQTATEVVKYTVTDQYGKTDTSSVTITIVGVNDAAVLSSAVKNLTEGDTPAAISASGTLTISDVDSPAKFVAQSNKPGAYGHFSINNAGAWSYVADSAHNEFAAGTVHTDKFIVSSADGTTTTVTINIAGTNDAAVLSSQTVNLTEGNTAADISTSGTLTVSDVDSPALFVAQSNTAGAYGHFSIDSSGAWTYVADSAHNEFAPGTLYTDVFAVTSADGTATSVTVNIAGTADGGAPALNLTYLLKVDGIAGDSTVDGYEGYFAVDAYTFGVLNQLSGGTGGGGGAGRATFDPLMVDLAGLPPGLATLMANAATGRHIPTIDLVGLNVAGDQTSEIYHLKLNDVTVAGVATGDDTAIAFNYGRVTETIKGQNPDGSLDSGQTFSYDFRETGASITPVDHDALASFAHAGDGPELTYLLKIDGIAGDSTIEGYEGYFAVDAYTFGVLTQLSGGTGGGGAVGRAEFDPLLVNLAGLPPGLATLMANAATGRHIQTIDLVGLNITHDQTSEVYHLKLGDVTVGGVVTGDDTAVAFNYGRVTETIKGQNPDGSLDSGQTFSYDFRETGASITPVDHDALANFAHSSGDGPDLTYLMKIDGIAGDSTLEGYEDYFAVDAYTFGVLTQLSGGTGGGGAVGRAEFDPLLVNLAGLPPGLATLMANAATGRHIPTIDLVGLNVAGGENSELYHLKLNDVTVAGVATGDDTAVAFNYGRVTETIKGQNPDGSLDSGQSFSYDFRETGASITPVDHDTLAAFAHSGDSPDLTYLLKIDGIAGDSTLEGYEDYFAVDAYTFGVLNQLSGGTGGGGGAGRATFDPLLVNLAGLPPGLATVMANAATGRHIPTIDLVGLNITGDQTSEVYHLKLGDVTVGGVVTGDDTAVAFNYGRVTETIKGQNPDGSLDSGQSFSYDFRETGASITPVDHDALANFAHSSGDGPDLTYLLKVDGIPGDSTVDGYEGYFAVDAYTFGVLNQLAGGTGGGGAVGRAEFDPLLVNLAGLPPGLATLMANAATGRHIPTIDLVGLNVAGGENSEIYHLKLNDVTVAGVATGDDTAVAFNYGRVTETIKGQNPDGSLDSGQSFSYDFRETGASITPLDHDALAAFAHPSGDGPELTYLLKIDGIAGDSTLEGYEDYFAVDAYTFGVLTQLSGGTGGGGGIGRAEFDPLMVDLASQPPGVATLMANAATGRHIPTIDLVGLNITDDQTREVYHLKLSDVTVGGIVTGNDTGIAFNYGRVSETIKGQNPDGSLDSGQSFSYDFRETGASITPVDHDELAAFAFVQPHGHGDYFIT
jgi:VCBS repeat-containing protein